MTNQEITKGIESIERRTGFLIGKNAATTSFIEKWMASESGDADPFNLPAGLSSKGHEGLISGAKAECHRAIDIIAMWPAGFSTPERVRKLFSIPILCERQISMLSLYWKDSFLKTSIIRPYKSICKTTTLYSLDQYKEEFLRRHVEEEIRCPGVFSNLRNPYGDAIAEIAAIAKRASSPPPPPPPPRRWFII